MRTFAAALLAALFLLPLESGALAAQQIGVIEVVVKEPTTTRAFPQVSVTVSGNGVLEQRFTGEDGRAVFPVPAGTYSVSISMLQYEDHVEAGVAVAAGESTTLTHDLVLSSEPSFTLRSIVVSGARRLEKNTRSVNHIELVERPADERPSTTPVDYVANMPGVAIISQGIQSRNPVIRGFNNIFSGALHALTDNRIAGVPSLRVNLLHFVPPNDDDIQRVELVLGPGSALYGPNTANGVMHIITKSPLVEPEHGTTISVAGGERELFKGQFRTSHLLSDNLGVKVSGQFMRGHDWLFIDPFEVAAADRVRTQPEQVRREILAQDPDASESEIQARMDRIGNRDLDFQRFAGEFRGDWRVNDAGALLVFQTGFTNADGIELTGLGAGRTEDWIYSYYQTRFSWDRFFAQAYLNTSDAGESFLVRQGAPLVDRSRVWAGQLQYGIGVGDLLSNGVQRQDFTFGADYSYTNPRTEGRINGQYEDDDNVTEIGAYLQSETALTERLSLVLAARVDDSSILDDPVFSPRAGLVFEVAPGHVFRGTFNKAFSMPTTLNYFLDINGGLAPGDAGQLLGYFTRAQGTGENGLSFQNPDGSLRGMLSPFNLADPGQLLPVDPSLLWQMTVGAGLGAGLISQQEAGIIGAIDASNVSVLLIDPVTRQPGPLVPGAVPDTPPLKESTTETYEVGYKGLFAEKLSVVADVWYSERKNFTSPLTPLTPLIILNPEQYIPLMIQAGIDPARAQQIALGSEALGIPGVSELPVGVVSSPDVQTSGTADIVASYVNFGKVDLWGWDLSVEAHLTDRISLQGAASWINDDFFVVRDDKEIERVDSIENTREVLSLNAPDFKGAVSLRYADDEAGFSAEGRLRHTSEFPVNSADFVGLACLPGLRVTAIIRECVEAATVVDLTLGYDLPGWQGAELQLDISNILDNDHRNFVGVPRIGRFALLQVKYSF